MGAIFLPAQEVSISKQMEKDISQRFPGATIEGVSMRTGFYRVQFLTSEGDVGGISYFLNDESFKDYSIVYSELPSGLYGQVTSKVKLENIIRIRFSMKVNEPGFYTVRTKNGALIFDEEYRYLKNGVLLSGLQEVPEPIVSHLQNQYENLTIKESRIKDNFYIVRIEFKLGTVLSQAGMVRYTEDFKWVDTSNYFWDLSKLPLEIYLALDEYGGIESVQDARQFFLPEGEHYFMVNLKNRNKLYFDSEFSAMEEPQK